MEDPIEISFPHEFEVPEWLNSSFKCFTDKKIIYSVDISSVLSHIIIEMETLKKYLGDVE